LPLFSEKLLDYLKQDVFNLGLLSKIAAKFVENFDAGSVKF
jgi:hypothetical protein